MEILQRLANNWPLKLLALGLAVLLSLYIYRVVDPEVEERQILNLEVANIRPGLCLASTEGMPETVSIVLVGPHRAVQHVLRNARTATAECSNIATAGLHSVDVLLPPVISSDVEVKFQEPQKVDLVFEEEDNRGLPIEVRPRGALDPDYDPGNESLSANLVEVSGPVSVVSQIETAQIEPDINGLKSNSQQLLAVRLLDANGVKVPDDLLKYSPRHVRYELVVVPRDSLRGLRITPLFEGRIPDGYYMDFDRLSVEPSYVTLEKELVPSGMDVLFTAPINLSDRRDSFTVTVPVDFATIEIPEVSRVSPDCTVTVVVVPIDETESLRVPLTMTGQRKGLVYFPSPLEVLLRSEELSLLTSQQRREIKVELNLAELGPGVHRLSPQLRLPPALEHVTIDPNSLSVIVQQED